LYGGQSNSMADYTTRKDILKEAIELTTNDRNASYGEPYFNHERIAQIWSVILGHTIQPSQVALCMAGLKLARLAGQSTPDSYVDGAAYFAIAGELHEIETIRDEVRDETWG